MAADPAGLSSAMVTTPPAWQKALAACGARTATLFEHGRPLLAHTRGRLRWELAATWHGGRRILERLEQSRFDPVAHRPTLGAADALVIGWRLLAS